MGQAFLGPNGGDYLGLGIDVDVKEQLVAVRHGETEVRNPTARAVTVVLWIMNRFGEFGDRDLGARQVGIAKAEVHHVATRGARFGLQTIDLSEDVGRQSIDPTEFHQ